MKLDLQALVLPAVAVVACAAGFGAAQTPQQPTATQRLEALEKEVATLEADLERVTKLTSGAEQTKKLVESVVAWAEAQAAAAERLERALADAEAKGFTKGINWESREALLAGMNDLAGTLQEDVPRLPAPEPDKSAPPRRQ
jgi:hypothetical protein